MLISAKPTATPLLLTTEGIGCIPQGTRRLTVYLLQTFAVACSYPVGQHQMIAEACKRPAKKCTGSSKRLEGWEEATEGHRKGPYLHCTSVIACGTMSIAFLEVCRQ